MFNIFDGGYSYDTRYQISLNVENTAFELATS